MLVYYKTKLALYPEHNNKRIDANITEILRDSHVTLGGDKKDEMLMTFEEDGLIELPNGGKQAKYFYLHFIDDEQQEVGVVVEDFFDFYLYYEQIEKGGRLIYCQECGKLVLSKSATKTEKYCSKCRKAKNVEFVTKSRKSKP